MTGLNAKDVQLRTLVAKCFSKHLSRPVTIRRKRRRPIFGVMLHTNVQLTGQTEEPAVYVVGHDFEVFDVLLYLEYNIVIGAGCARVACIGIGVHWVRDSCVSGHGRSRRAREDQALCKFSGLPK